MPNINESRRHSLADIPTRRGSLAAGEPSLLSRTYTHDVFEVESPTSIGSARKSSPNIARDMALQLRSTPSLSIAPDSRAFLIGLPRRHLIHLYRRQSSLSV